MIANHVAAGLRHLARNKLYFSISIAGLAVGLWAAVLAALVIHQQFSNDHFIAGHGRIYAVKTSVTPPGRASVHMANASTFVAPQLALRYGEIEAATRLALQSATLRRGPTEATEPVYWTDPNGFEVLPMPVVAGDLRSALRRPDAVVLTRQLARKYFGRDAPVGESVVVDGSHTMIVAAVLEDFPEHGTHLAAGIFLPATAPWSWLGAQDRIAGNVPGADVGFGTNTYVRLKAGASPRRLLDATSSMAGALFARPPPDWKVALQLVRLDRLNTDRDLNPGFAARMTTISVLAAVILLIAGINFVNLHTARAARRALEVGIRKTAGAQRHTIVLQFLGESAVQVSAAMLIAIALTEWSLPRVNAFLSAGASLSYWGSFGQLGVLALAVSVISLLAGVYPALLHAALRPVEALKGDVPRAPRSELVRHGLVTLQFAVLIGLLIAAGVIHQQRRFAMSDALPVDTRHIVLVRSSCRDAVVAELAKIAEVQAVSCSDAGLLGQAQFTTAKSRDGVLQLLYVVVMQPALFETYGIRPVAGGRRGGDSPHYLINETAARRLGFASPRDAIGQTLPALGRGDAAELPIAGVVPDFSFASVEKPIDAMMYLQVPRDRAFDMISVKLTGAAVPATLSALDRALQATAGGEPVSRFFMEDHLARLYAPLQREGQAFGAFSLVAVVLACLGLLALSSAAAERRTREIGIRKAMGAGTGNIASLLLWQFGKPVLMANLIAWPLAAYAMDRWLQQFAYRIDLRPWLFVAATLAALVIAVLTVGAHTWLVARAKPVAALRYE